MQTFEIKNSWNKKVIASTKEETLKKAVEKMVKDETNLAGAYLAGADLAGADLSRAYLPVADLTGANLTGAYLTFAYLAGADLSRTCLTEADLNRTYLTGAYLTGAKDIAFYRFPSLSIFTQFDLGNLPGNLTIELMRRNAEAHPYPEKFDELAKVGFYPYMNEERYFWFDTKKELWKPGPPKMKTSDLIIELCKHFGWHIKGHLE